MGLYSEWMVFDGVQWNLMGLYSELMDYEWDIPFGNDCYIANRRVAIEIMSFPSEKWQYVA